MRIRDVLRGKLGVTSNNEESTPNAIRHEGSFGNEIMLRIQESLGESMHLRDSIPEKFICKEKLDKVWLQHPVKIIPAFENLSENELKAVERRFLRVLSILIFIGWDLVRFRPVFLRTDLDDSKLFFSKEQLQELGLNAQAFYDSQSIFKPVVIKQSPEVSKQNIDINHRLPFITKPELLGKGGFGEVTKRVIAAGCFEETRVDEPPISNQEAKVVACKEFKSERPEGDFKDEVNKLDFIKDALIDHKNVLKHLAAIVYGNRFLILFPFVQHFNLEIFLRAGFEPQRSTADAKQKYSFETKFPLLDDDLRRHRAIVEQMWGLASALLWLHRDLRIFSRKDRYLAHNDFKPENILIDGNPDDKKTPAGRWKLTDFGISAFDKSTNARVEEVPSLRDFTARITTSSRPRRGHGPYQPPEVTLKREKIASSLYYPDEAPDLDGRKCDAWSFACVLCDLLAFALDRNNGVSKLRQVKFDGQNDNFYSGDDLPINRDTVITTQNTWVKNAVVAWWDDIKLIRTAPWVPAYVSIVEQTMKPRPEDRKDLEFITDRLFNLQPLLTYNESQHQHESAPQPEFRNSLLRPDRYSPPDSHLNDSHNPSSTSSQRIDNVSDTSDTLSNNNRTCDTPPVTTIQITPQILLQPNKKVHLEKAIPFAYRSSIIKALAIEASGMRVAILCETHENRVHVLPTREDSSSNENRHLSRKLDSPGLCLSYPYFAAFGNDIMDQYQKHGEIHNLSNSRAPKILKGEDLDGVLSNVVMSGTGVTVCIYDTRARLYFPRSDTLPELAVPQKNKASIHAAAFSRKDSALFLWAKGPSIASDHVYVFSVDESAQTAALTKSVDLLGKESSRFRSSAIWPSVSGDFCVINELLGAFIARPTVGARDPEKRVAVKMTNVIYGLLPNDDMVLCIREKALVAYSIVSSGDGERSLSSKRNELGKIVVGKMSVMAVQAAKDHYDIIICCPEKGILRFTQAP